MTTKRTEPAVVLAGLAATLLLSGCGDGVTPVINSLGYDGQAPDSPLVLLFHMVLHDDNGDLAAGSYETFLNDRATASSNQALFPLFLDAGLAPTATDGPVNFIVELALPAGEVQHGSSVHLSVRVTDESAHTSNTQAVALRLQ
jgi:hypothetical protein